MRMTPILLVTALAIVSLSTPVSAITMYGALSNFDAINDTGSTAHGFEITLEGCSKSDVFGTFGDPYNRYGNPTVTDNGAGVTTVLYESLYSGGKWTQGTVSGSLPDTGGHSLYIGSGYTGFTGDLTNTVPGDHFGVALSINPTKTTYRWLLGTDGNPNLTPAGTSVQIPVPVVSIGAPANPVNPAGVQVAVQAPPPQVEGQLGKAIWEKVFITTVEKPDPVELHHLVLGDPAVAGTETEVEWQVLQAGNGQVANAGERDDKFDVMDPAAGAVTRRYEFYEYLGAYDPETNEAITEIPTPDPDHPGSYLDVGNFIGGQNIAANFAVPEPSTISLVLGACGVVLAYCWRKRQA